MGQQRQYTSVRGGVVRAARRAGGPRKDKTEKLVKANADARRHKPAGSLAGEAAGAQTPPTSAPRREVKRQGGRVAERSDRVERNNPGSVEASQVGGEEPEQVTHRRTGRRFGRLIRFNADTRTRTRAPGI